MGAFRQFDRARYEQQGSGMGLALVRAIAEATGGRLEIVSRPGEGTTVRVLWPA
jgi:signal transduction histidine kinase